MAPMKPEAGGGQVPAGGGAWQKTPVSTVSTAAAPSDSARLLSYVVRLVAVVLTLVATIVMGVAKQKVILYDDSSDYSLEAEAKSTYNSSYVYFIIVNTIACLYSAVSVGVAFTNQNSSAADLPLSIADVLITVLLFTGNASATAIQIVAQKGNNHFGWAKICNYTHKFCDHVTAAIVLSTVAAVAYALLLVLAMISLQRKPR